MGVTHLFYSKENAEKVQEMLDAGDRISVIARALNVHHMNIVRMIERFNLEEGYIPFDEAESKSEPFTLTWLHAEDLLESMLNEAFELRDVVTDDFFGEHSAAVSSYVRATYGNIASYVIKRNHKRIIGYLKARCSTCGVVEGINKYTKDNQSAFGLYAKCTTCRGVDSKRRVAILDGLYNSFTAEDRVKTLARFNGRCALTGSAEKIHLDHVIPISISYAGTFYGNMIPLRGDLNSSKSDSNIFEWFAAHKDRYGLSQTKFDELIAWLAAVNDLTVEGYRDYVCVCHEHKKEVKA